MKKPLREVNIYPMARLLKIAKEAKDHLEFCGYGDSYEREAAFANKLPERFDRAIEEVEKEIKKLGFPMEKLKC